MLTLQSVLTTWHRGLSRSLGDNEIEKHCTSLLKEIIYTNYEEDIFKHSLKKVWQQDADLNKQIILLQSFSLETNLKLL